MMGFANLKLRVMLWILQIGITSIYGYYFVLYTLTMNDTENQLAIIGGNANFELTLVKQISTGGVGGPVQSQNSLVVHGNYIFAVNPLSDTISMFSITVNNPTDVTLVGSPISSKGNYPVSVTANDKFVCVTNSGAVNGFCCFPYTSTGISNISSSCRSFGLNLTTPPANHKGPGQISFTPDNSGLIIVIKGFNPPVYLYTIDSAGTTSTFPAVSAAGGSVNFAFVFDQSAGTVVLVDAAPYNNGSGIIVIDYSCTGVGNINFATPNYYLIPSQVASCWIAVSNQSGIYYVSNAGSKSISILSLIGTTFTVLNTINDTIGAQTDILVLTINGNDYFFTNNVGNQQIGLWHAATGNLLTTVNTYSSGAGLGGIVINSKHNAALTILLSHSLFLLIILILSL